MTKTNTNKNNQKNRTDTRKRMSTAAILLSAIALISSSALASVHSISLFAGAPTNSSSSMTNINYTKTLDHMLVQNLTKTNVPVTLPLTRGYVNGFEVFYISTEASDKGLADHLTNLTHSRVSYAPALKNAPPQSLANIYVFQTKEQDLWDINQVLPRQM